MQVPGGDAGDLARGAATMGAAYARLPLLAGGGVVTRQPLRLVVADRLEQRFSPGGGDWAPTAGWQWSDGAAASTAPGEYPLTRGGLVAAVRFLADYAEPYGHYFPRLIADMLNVPLQVLFDTTSRTRSVIAATENLAPGGGTARHTIVLVDQHYLAARPVPRGGPTSGSSQPPSPASPGGSGASVAGSRAVAPAPFDSHQPSHLAHGGQGAGTGQSAHAVGTTASRRLAPARFDSAGAGQPAAAVQAAGVGQPPQAPQTSAGQPVPGRGGAPPGRGVPAGSAGLAGVAWLGAAAWRGALAGVAGTGASVRGRPPGGRARLGGRR